MKIGVISDTHLKTSSDIIPFRKSLVQLFKGVDAILHAGDLITLEVLKELESVAKTMAVAGNMDYPQVIQALPPKRVLNFGLYKIGLIHGWGSPNGLADRVKREFKDADVDCIVFGHSHTPFNQRIEGVLFFNPGSPTDKFFAPFNSLGILEIDQDIQGEIIRV